MKSMGIFMGAVVIAFLLVAFSSVNPVSANSCCGVQKKDNKKECNIEDAEGCVKEISDDEGADDACPVCGKAAGSKGNQVDVEHDGKTAHLCCEGCANAYNANPDKYSKSEAKEEHPKSKHPKKKKERGAGYY